ncbi:MAG: hypothetical protein IKX14_03395 [Neisseriaceae bacterium]|nr:hypothetical protein [Neisseriaceae bacterium]
MMSINLDPKQFDNQDDESVSGNLNTQQRTDYTNLDDSRQNQIQNSDDDNDDTSRDLPTNQSISKRNDLK